MHPVNVGAPTYVTIGSGLDAVFVDSVASSLNVGNPNVGKLPTRVACSIGFLAIVYPLE